MTGWIIFGVIVLILVFAFTRFVSVTAVYDKKPEVTVKVFLFTVAQIPADPEKAARKAARKARKEQKKKAAGKKKDIKDNKVTSAPGQKETAADDPDDNKAGAAVPAEKKGSGKKEKQPAAKRKLPALDAGMIMDYVRSAAPPVKRLFRKIKLRDVYIDWVAGSDEAGKTALKYGGLCLAFYSLFEWLETYFDVKTQEINIEADLQAEKDDIFIYLTLKLRISTALACVIWLGFRVLKTYLKYNSSNNVNKAKKKPSGVKGRKNYGTAS